MVLGCGSSLMERVSMLGFVMSYNPDLLDIRSFVLCTLRGPRPFVSDFLPRGSVHVKNLAVNAVTVLLDSHCLGFKFHVSRSFVSKCIRL